MVRIKDIEPIEDSQPLVPTHRYICDDFDGLSYGAEFAKVAHTKQYSLLILFYPEDGGTMNVRTEWHSYHGMASPIRKKD